MSRTSRAISEKIARVEVGDIDIVSKAAYQARVPLCAAPADVLSDRASAGEPRCTRAAGHDESNEAHPCTHHVATGLGFRVRAVWL